MALADLESVSVVRPSTLQAEYANRWALTHGLPVPYPALRDTPQAPVPASWGKRRLETERAAVARLMARHNIECSRCAASRGDLTRSCQHGYDLARQHRDLTDAWWQLKGGQPPITRQSALW